MSQDIIRLVNFYTGTLCSYMDLKNLLWTIVTLSSQHPSPCRCLCRPPPPSPAAPSRCRCNQMSPSTYAIIPPYRCCFPIVRSRQIKSSTNTIVVVVVVINARPLARPPTIMPGAEATDPANLQAHACAQLGLSRELEQTRCVTPHPSHGCGGGVDVSESSL
jgi:hypothetical protein